jgi:hypothetical protein
MSDVIDEINGALQLDEGLKAEGAMNIEIPPYASQSKLCASFETTSDELKWQTTFIGKSTSDCELVSMNPKRKKQQPQISTTQSHGSRLVFQIILIYYLVQKMTGGLIVNNLCCGTL